MNTRSIAMSVAKWIGEGVLTILVVGMVYHAYFFWPQVKYACSTKDAGIVSLDLPCVAKSFVVLPIALRRSAEHSYERDFLSEPK